MSTRSDDPSALLRQPVRVATRIVDSTGAVLAVGEALATPRCARRAEPELDAGTLLGLGHETPGYGPGAVPTLHRASSPEEPRTGTDADTRRAQPARQDAPPGSALSTLDARAYLEQIAREHAATDTPQHH